jgi:hypothetical protein
VEIRLSCKELVQMTGTTVYTVSWLVSAWEARGLVTWHPELLMNTDVKALREVFEPAHRLRE